MTQTLLHTDAFTQKNFYTQTCAHSTLLRTASFLHGKTLLPLPDHLPFRVPPSSFLVHWTLCLFKIFRNTVQTHVVNTHGNASTRKYSKFGRNLLGVGFSMGLNISPRYFHGVLCHQHWKTQFCQDIKKTNLFA